MFLSRVALDPTKRAVMIALQNPAMFHGAVERAFEPRTERALWRIDTLRGQKYLMLLSEEEPELSSIAEQFGIGEEPETRSYDPLLNRIHNGDRWRFRLCANPTYSRPKPNGRGSVCAHKTVQHQCEWLIEQAMKHGFKADSNEFTVVNTRWYSFGKSTGSHVKLLSVTFEGVLTVTDEEAFRDALKNGIGRGKAYGMGMMTIVKA